MRLHRLEYRQRLGISPQQAWDFFSDPANLASITPPWLDFEVTGPLSGTAYPGQLICYRIRPLAGIALAWVTEITHLRSGEFFVDEQRFGPYRFWHHQHHFRGCPGGVDMADLIHYRMPLGPLGELLNRVLVRRRLERIFAHRRQVLAERFGELP